MAQLDSLRTVAVLMVVLSHWEPRLSTSWFNGYNGVQLFFVISGFLITGILLDGRVRAEQAGSSCRGVLKSFYVRRVLRIFPLFYATLAVTFVLGFPAVRQSLFWHVAYLSNVFFAIRGTWFNEVSHLWSLAVEEQFYFVWPFLVLFVPRRWLLPLIVAAVVSAPLFRLACHFFGVNETAVAVMPFSSLDALGLGALLALLQRERFAGVRSVRAYLASLCVIGCATFAVLLVTAKLRELPWALSFLSVALVPVAGLALVWLAANRLRGPAGWLMELAPVVYLGQISYGVYMFHAFVPDGTAKIFRMLRWHPEESSGLVLGINFAVLIVASSLSWHLFESRINKLKRLFPYTSTQAVG